MSLSVVYTRAAIGVKAPLISVEVHLSNGLPGLTLVGLPETTVKEARIACAAQLLIAVMLFRRRRSPLTLRPPICQRRRAI